jgi:hypothetical protein
MPDTIRDLSWRVVEKPEKAAEKLCQMACEFGRRAIQKP